MDQIGAAQNPKAVRQSRPSRFTSPLTQDQILTEVLPDLIQRIVSAANPLRIILFGSAARGQMHAGSDLDVLVVVADTADQNQVSKAIYRSLRGLGMAADAVVVSQGNLALHLEDPWMIYHAAMNEGKELYHASA